MVVQENWVIYWFSPFYNDKNWEGPGKTVLSSKLATGGLPKTNGCSGADKCSISFD